MEAGTLIPLASFAVVVLIVALANFSKIHDLEMRARENLGHAEAEHRIRLAELDRQLNQLRQEVQ